MIISGVFNLIYKRYIYFFFILSSFVFSQDPPELFEYNQSTLQNFYFFSTVVIDDVQIDADDWVGVFKGDVCVGARRWDTSACGGGMCDAPAMGDDGAVYTEGYMLPGDIPTFKIYDASEDIYYEAIMSNDYSQCEDSINCSWSNFGFNTLDQLFSDTTDSGIPELFLFNISTLSAYYLFYDAFDINGENLQTNDWVGAFNGDVCVGAKKWDTSLCGGSVCDVPVMGDDGSDYSEGYMQTGGIPSFKIYDASEGIYYDAIVSETFTWGNFDLNMLDYVQAVEYVELSIPLHYENNLISFYTLPDNAEISNVISEIEDDLVGIVGESFSAQNNNGIWEGSLTQFDTYNGYWFRMSSDSDMLTVMGPPPDPNKIYGLHSGLNLISFPTSGSVSISDGIDDNIENEIPFIIGESKAAAQLDEQWVGSLTEFEGGRGYWINSNIALDFQYNLENLSLSRRNNLYPEINEFSFNQSKSQAFYFMNLGNLSNANDINEGDWIIAYNDNVIVGSRQWNGGIVDVPVMGYDGHNGTAGYCNENDIPTFKIYSIFNNQLLDISSNDIKNYIPNSITYVEEINSISTNNFTPKEFNLVSIYPNPFNPITTIRFSIPINSNVSIVIYDLKGEEISRLVDENYAEGYHQVNWDASPFTSGLYLVKMIVGDFQCTQKLMLIK